MKKIASAGVLLAVLAGSFVVLSHSASASTRNSRSHGNSTVIVTQPKGTAGAALSVSVVSQTGKVVTLSLNADSSTVKGYAIGLTPNLSDAATIISYTGPQVTYALPDANAHTIYLKYYSNSGAWSPVVSVTTTAQTAGTGTATFTRSLKEGMTGSDVQALQVFLNAQGFTVAASGPGSPGNETTLFTPAMTAALIKFQDAHASVLLTPAGLTSGTGVFGHRTRALVNGME